MVTAVISVEGLKPFTWQPERCDLYLLDIMDRILSPWNSVRVFDWGDEL